MALEDGIFDVHFDGADCRAGSDLEGIHDELPRDRRLKIADAVFFFDEFEFFGNEFEILFVPLDFEFIFTRDIGVAQ